MKQTTKQTNKKHHSRSKYPKNTVIHEKDSSLKLIGGIINIRGKKREERGVKEI